MIVICAFIVILNTIQIRNNTQINPNIIVCNYKYINIPLTTPPVYQIILTYISNFDINANSYINFFIPDNYISSINASGFSYQNNILKISVGTKINKNTITTPNPINVTYNSPAPINGDKYSTTGFITLS